MSYGVGENEPNGVRVSGGNARSTVQRCAGKLVAARGAAAGTAGRAGTNRTAGRCAVRRTKRQQQKAAIKEGRREGVALQRNKKKNETVVVRVVGRGMYVQVKCGVGRRQAGRRPPKMQDKEGMGVRKI